jgi:signal peptidase I
MSGRFGRMAGEVWREWVRGFLIVLAVVGSFRSAVADWNDVPTGSMKPTIVEGDRIVVNKLAYGLRVPFTSWRLLTWEEPQRGDIVVLFSPKDGTRLVKRVVGVPGDRLDLRDDRLYVNGRRVQVEPMDASLAARLDVEGVAPDGVVSAEELGGRLHAVMTLPDVPAMRFYGPVLVPKGEYFVMGDNRDNSSDSRVFGFVPEHLIVGRATAVAVSVDVHHHFRPRWHRFFTRLH